MFHNDNKFSLIIIAICIFAIIMGLNQWLQKNVQEITRHPTSTQFSQDSVKINTNIALSPIPVTTEKTDQPASPYRKYGQKVLRKDRMSPGRDFMESIFYLDNQKIAAQRIVNNIVTESSGQIPQGKVEFTNESQETHGIEHYLNGQKNGPSLTYLSNGQLNIDAYYQDGALLREKKYYTEGNLRLEVNYKDARTNPASKEAGNGKIYNKDGTVKYEWHFTQDDKTGFQKSYDPDGTLRAAVYFDENEQPITP